MIDFMVIGLPRSGTTWVTNLLNTADIFCKHDPLYETHYREIDSVYGAIKHVNGISCTGLWRWPDWVNSHPATKIIIHRRVCEVEESLDELGLHCDIEDHSNLNEIEGLHIGFEQLFDVNVWENVLWPAITNDLPFDRVRFEQLTTIAMEPMFARVEIDRNLQAGLFEELKKGR